jgi:hypothetical protein
MRRLVLIHVIERERVLERMVAALKPVAGS